MKIQVYKFKGDRFFVDERDGCIAVRDKMFSDPQHRTLLPSTKGVLRYWKGEYIKGAYRYEVPESIARKARKLCDLLNEE
jgi:hypothetical protein